VNALLVASFLGWMLIALSAVQSAPIVAALLFGEPVLPYLATALAGLVCGVPIVVGVRPSDLQMQIRDGFLVVALAWGIASVVGAMPFVIAGTLGPVDALFESASGFTTTGSTVMTSISTAPHALLLWRSLTQWLGGIGIILFAVALMPLLGVGGMRLFKAEVPGPIADKLTPRIADTARRLWLIYVGLTALEWILLVWAGMTPYDAICHAFTTMSTGGFSTLDASIGGFQSPLIEWIVIVFMTLGGMNFVLHYRLLSGQFRAVWEDEELRYYVVVIAVSIAIVGWTLFQLGVADSVRTATFQVLSIVTTTGYATADFEVWPSLALLVLLQLMMLGGMAGSTSGGIKSLRTLIGVRTLASVFSRMGHRGAVGRPVRYAGRRVPDEVVSGVWAFLVAYVLTLVAVAMLVAGSGYDMVTAVSAALTCVGNVGPGLGEIGPFDNFAHFSGTVKVVLSGAMIAGRLELFTLLILFHPDFWRH